MNPRPEARAAVTMKRRALAFGLPLLVSVSRKSFLTALAKPGATEDPSLGAELFAAARIV